jgi:biotin carboxylase
MADARHLGVLESNLSGSGYEGLRIAKELGLRVTFFTRDLQRYLDVPGARRYFVECVDEIVFAETNELAPIAERVAAVHERDPFAAFMTMGEYDVVLAAELGHRLGLPAPSPEGVRTARNKVLSRRAAAAAGVPQPRFAAVRTPAEAVSAAAELGLPCVVKPADETSSTDVARCHSLNDVAEHAARIKRKPVNSRGQRRYPLLLVEEYLQGHEVSAEILAEGDQYRVLGVTDKIIGGVDRFVELGHLFPSVLPPALADACAEVAVAGLRAVGFDLGLAHVEVKVTGAGPRLIEINPRPAGDRITDLVDLSYQRPCLEFVIRQYLGESVLAELAGLAPQGGAAIRYLSGPAGRVTAIHGRELAARIPGVRDVVLEVEVGDEVRTIQRNRDRLGHVLAVAEHPYVADRIAAAAAHEVTVLVRSALDAVRSTPDAVRSADVVRTADAVRSAPDAGRGAEVGRSTPDAGRSMPAGRSAQDAVRQLQPAAGFGAGHPGAGRPTAGVAVEPVRER